jgi:hypothetical protein
VRYWGIDIAMEGADHPGMMVLRRGIAVILALSLLSSCATMLHPERKGNASGVDAAPLVLDILLLAAGVVPGVVAIAVDFRTGAIYTREYQRERERKRSGRLDATKAAQAEFLNEAFDDLPYTLTDSSRMRLLHLTMAYRQHRKKHGDNEDVHESLRRLENGLFFWDMDKGFPVGDSGSYEYVGGRGEPMVAVQGYGLDPGTRYRYRRAATTSIMPFSSITTIKEGLGGLAIPSMTGFKLTRRAPDDLHMEPRAAIAGATERLARGHQPSSTADAILECGIELLGAAACQELLSDVTSDGGAALSCSAAQQMLQDGRIDAAKIASDVILDRAGSLGQGILFLLCVADRS